MRYFNRQYFFLNGEIYLGSNFEFRILSQEFIFLNICKKFDLKNKKSSVNFFY